MLHSLHVHSMTLFVYHKNTTTSIKFIGELLSDENYRTKYFELPEYLLIPLRTSQHPFSFLNNNFSIVLHELIFFSISNIKKTFYLSPVNGQFTGCFGDASKVCASFNAGQRVSKQKATQAAQALNSFKARIGH